MFEEVCRERAVTIERRYAETLLIECQEEHILEAVENLISNAIDAMPGGGTLTVAIGKETIKGSPYATITVTDNGEGIKDEHLARIFEPFFTTRVASKGVGLGLSLTKKFAEDHEGTVSVESGSASGSTFTLRLPALTE
jgi:signal transduction histidine kinase